MQQNTTEECAGCSMQQDPPARTMVLLFSAEGNKIQLFTSVASGLGLGLSPMGIFVHVLFCSHSIHIITL